MKKLKIREVNNLLKVTKQLSVLEPKLSDSKDCALNPEAKLLFRSVVS